MVALLAERALWQRKGLPATPAQPWLVALPRQPHFFFLKSMVGSDSLSLASFERERDLRDALAEPAAFFQLFFAEW